MSQRPFNAADARVIQAARNLCDYMDKLVPAKLLIVGSYEEVVMQGLISRLEDLKVALLTFRPETMNCPRCWRTLEQREECTDEKCIKRIPEGHGSHPVVASESGSPLDAPRGANPEGDASGGVLPEIECEVHGKLGSKDGKCPSCSVYFVSRVWVAGPLPQDFPLKAGSVLRRCSGCSVMWTANMEGRICPGCGKEASV